VQSSNQLRVAVHTVGCKLNQAESETIAREFAARGYEVVGPRDDADIYVLNTCTVTAEADRKVRQWLRSARRRNSSGLIVAAGCGVERDEAALGELSDICVDNADKSRLVELVVAHLESRGLSCAQGDALVVPDGASRTRTVLKVQEGCTTFCAYCIVPSVRPGEHSVLADEVVDSVARRVAEGYREIVLTGTKIGVYRDGDTDLTGLLKRVLSVLGPARIRLSSLQPRELSRELLALWQDSRLCPHFHLSLQSGSDSVLRRMGRDYTLGEYDGALGQLREAVPGCAITTDIIVGFPGETEQEFSDSYEYCGSAGFARIHVFPYSPRPGTRAAEMDGRLSGREMKERADAMGSLADDSLHKYAQSWLDRCVEALWEGHYRGSRHVWSGTTGNYLHVLCESSDRLHNVIESVTPVRIEGDRVWVRRSDEGSGGCEAELQGARH